MNIPTVTESDLLQYHASHFGAPFPPDKLMVHAYAGAAPTRADYDAGEEKEEDDGLGYYPDGAKRTLTAEQVAMFRHSEIQSLLRERRLAAEAQLSPSPPATPQTDPQAQQAPAPKNEPQPNTGYGESGPEDNEEEKEYARFLAAERQEFQSAAAHKRNGERGREMYGYEEGDRTVSTRRRVREMDVVRSSEDVTMLMYDDEPSEPARPDKVQTQKETAEGRKIWFPMIG